MPILDIFFPKHCLQCRQKGQYICKNCASHSFRTFRPPPDYIDNIIVIWKYEGVIRKAILALKYRFAEQIANELAELAANELKNYNLPENSYIVPIPLHKRRHNWRGFNQSESIAKLLSKNLNIPYSNKVLIRKLHSTPQAKLKKGQRLRNIRGKYAVNENASREALAKLALAHNTIILFDDVITTGSTLTEAAKTLRKEFKPPIKIWAIALAG